MFKIIEKFEPKLLLAALVVFMGWLWFVLQVTFMQNDDWVYYQTVRTFMGGNIVLHPYIGPTFYLQGLIAAAFSKVFSIERLPVLTLFMTTISFYFFTLILVRFLKLRRRQAVLLGFLYFFNPLNLYLTLGFMTGNYFMPFLLMCIFLLLLFEETKKLKFLALTFIVSFLALLVRQVALSIPLSIALYYLYRRERLLSIVGFVVFGSFYFFYSNILTLTARILEVPLQFHHLADFNYTYALVYGVLIMLTAFLLPLVFSVVDWRVVISSKKRILLFVVISLGIFIVGNNIFKPDVISWGEFPYFENTFERTGFYPRGVDGTKYQFRGIYDLYRYWDLGAKLMFALFVGYLVVSRKWILNYFSVFAVTYIGLLVVTETFYDRYILILVPVAIFYLVSIGIKFNYLKITTVTLFVAFLAFYGYQFSMDFILVNSYVWKRAEELAISEDIPYKTIQATNAWKLSFRNLDRNYLYNFSYDSQDVNEIYKCCYKLIEEKTIEYPLNFFINPKIYLYKRI
ncbi:MAG: hypothetical protein UU80_C0022G0005 [candidate division WWE3 bacterium GW2011_GWA1_41_8]|uniref:Glycosyltransferase RgtA/B/C/D-like domain-containing protein n=2 Tax=Katanobacteria TaxID=422282 RepID=A0A0G0XBF2_UNCKA|nr:MAG: hypothetical protein UU72_C0026G0022 [candidate division WWE3 bacterium GW2011_GWB1_41_6]KKS21702.1 MAG: hypothetical protein UU80_C0022G0005 [candidate division WWE3 bacterium GW2011_GWA1_41_8]